MELPIQISLYVHIVSGGGALVAGLLSLLVNKGGKLHRRSGMVFFFSMLAVTLSAFFISVVKENSFLLAVSLFSFYMNYTGYRVLKNKKGKYKWFDWLVVGISSVAAVYMISTLRVVSLVFGVLLVFLILLNSLPQFQGEEVRKEKSRTRVLSHIGNMMGTYIATVTAFLVVNINFVKPGWLVWLLPTALGLPFIVYFTRKWKRKLNAA